MPDSRTPEQLRAEIRRLVDRIADRQGHIDRQVSEFADEIKRIETERDALKDSCAALAARLASEDRSADQNYRLGAMIRSMIDLLSVAPVDGGPPNLMRLALAIDGTTGLPFDRGEIVLYRPGGKTLGEVNDGIRAEVAARDRLIAELRCALIALTGELPMPTTTRHRIERLAAKEPS